MTMTTGITLFDWGMVSPNEPMPRVARARFTDPETSHEAAGSISNMALADSRAAVYIALMRRGPSTDADIVAWMRLRGTGFSESRIRTARSEMVADGRVRFTGGYERVAGHRRARIWIAVQS